MCLHARWRGHALARIGDPDAVRTLVSALDRLDPTFARAEAAVRVDLASAYFSTGELDQARWYADGARTLANQVGSKGNCHPAAETTRFACAKVRNQRQGLMQMLRGRTLMTPGTADSVRQAIREVSIVRYGGRRGCGLGRPGRR